MEEVNRTADDDAFDSGQINGADPGWLQTEQLNYVRPEIDTSPPIESVKEAATRFGGIGFWKPNSRRPLQVCSENGDGVLSIANMVEQAAQLEKDLILKERETLDVLKELESFKTFVEDLKSNLQKESSQVKAYPDSNLNDKNVVNYVGELTNEGEDKENCPCGMIPSSAPGLILMELKQAKLNLTRTTSDLADIRSNVETFNKKIEKERISLEKTRQRLSMNLSKISSLEEEINKTKHKLDMNKDNENPVDISREIQRLSAETEQFKKIGEAASTDVSRTMFEIEETKNRIKTAEIRLIAARKMKQAAKASEALALSEMKDLSRGDTSSGVTLSFEEYSCLITKSREAEEASKKKVNEAMLEVDKANVSRTEILKRVEEATEEVKSSKKVLEEALTRVEAASSSKLAVEEALRRWRSDHGQKRRTVHNSTKFKNTYPSHLRNNNGLNLDSIDSSPVLKPTLSIGQILSRKLLLTEDFGNGHKREKSFLKIKKVSLGHMLAKPKVGETQSSRKGERENGQLHVKRKKFGFGRISFLVAKPHNNKKKKHSPSSHLSCA